MPLVLAYHGCSIETARKLLGGSPFQVSNKPYDWLGSGSYFWEWDVVRAYEWAKERKPKDACVIGAVIELGNCLDLTTRTGTEAVQKAYYSYVRLQRSAGLPIPRNQPHPSSLPKDLVLRFLDRAVIDHLHSSFEEMSRTSNGRVQEFDTVRALFPEGDRLYEDSGFLKKTHVQIAVRTPQQIRGVFRVPLAELEGFGILNIYESLDH